MKKSVVSVLLLIALSAVVFAGGGAQSSAGGSDQMGVAIYKFDDTFMSYVRNAITQNAAGKITVNMVDSQNSQPVQNDQVDQFVTRKMKAIAINPVDRTAAGAIVDKAKAANIPVVFLQGTLCQRHGQMGQSLLCWRQS
jgi:methyl-galactoside transport system substrate-binding protein